MIHLSSRTINLHSLTEDSRHQKMEETLLWPLKPQHNSFHSCIWPFYLLANRTKLPSSGCGKATFRDLSQVCKSRCPSGKMLDRFSKVLGCKSIYTFVNHVTFPFRRLHCHSYRSLNQSGFPLLFFCQIRIRW